MLIVDAGFIVDSQQNGDRTMAAAAVAATTTITMTWYKDTIRPVKEREKIEREQVWAVI